jgi:hypothetical protein
MNEKLRIEPFAMKCFYCSKPFDLDKIDAHELECEERDKTHDLEIITIRVRVRRKCLDDAQKKILKLVSENNWL